MIFKGVCAEIEKIMRQFIWGGVNGHPKIDLVGWNSICQPRSWGGLGLHYIQDQNNFFLMKIGFHLATKSGALWVKVLRTKYRLKEKISSSIVRSQCSHLCHSLAKVWPFLCEHLAWSVGDGTSIRCWKDPWVPSTGPLLSFILTHANLDLECTLSDLVLLDWSWDLYFFTMVTERDELKDC